MKNLRIVIASAALSAACLTSSGQEKIEIERFHFPNGDERELFFDYLKNGNDRSYLTMFNSYSLRVQDESKNPDFNEIEGTSVTLEGHIAPSYYMIKPGAIRLKGLRNLALSFQGAFTLRLIKESSSPMLPPNAKAGFRLDYIVGSKKRSTVFLSSELMHYSNGGAPGSIDSVLLENTGVIRNDYESGDFSTNYFRLGGSYVTYYNVGRYYGYFNANPYYQQDFHGGELLNYFDIQKGRYGYHRLGLNLSFYQNYKGPIFDKKNFIALRYEPVVILKDAEILANSVENSVRDTDYRWSHLFQLTLGFEALGETGLFFQYYTGRDYLNIRYDQPISYFIIGLSFNSRPIFEHIEK